MTIAVIGHGANGRGTSSGGPDTNLVVTLTATPTDGNTLYALAGCHRDISNKHIDFPAGWTEMYHVDADAWCFKEGRKVASGDGNTVTFTFHDLTGNVASAVTDAVVVEVSGTYASTVTGQATTHGNPHTIPSITPTGSIEALMVALTANADPYNITAYPASYTKVDEYAVGGDARVVSYYLHAASTTGSYTGTYNMAGSAADWNVQAYFTILAAAPVAEFSYSFDSLTVFFFDESTNSPTSWAWDFGDGATSTSQNPTHIFASAGNYTVCLTATNSSGSDQVCHNVHPVDIVLPDLGAGKATVEIYVHDPSGARWDEALWDEAVWSTAGWVDVTPESIDAQIRWGVSDASQGILSLPDADTWAINFLDPDRKLDPANADSEFFGDIVPFLPVRVNLSGYTIRTGNAESIGHQWIAPTIDASGAIVQDGQDLGYMRITNCIARAAQGQVPEDTTLSDTLAARARDALDAAGLSDIVVLPLTDDPDLVAWTTGTAQSAWDWIVDAARQVLYQPYVDRNNQLGFRPYASPIFRANEVTDADMVSLQSIVTYQGNYSIVTAGAETRELTPKPVYGARTYTRTDPTPDDAAWAQAVLEDRSFTSLRWIPGETFTDDVARTSVLAKFEAVELISIIDNSTDPIVDAEVIVLGGQIRLSARVDDSALWWFTFECAQSGTELPLVVSGSDPPEFLLATGGVEYLYRSL